MSEKKNKVVYGLKNVMVWPIESTDDSGKPTYGAGFKMPGATEVALSPSGSNDPFYADDSVFYQAVANAGYDGDLTIADVASAFLEKVLGEKVDKNGAHVEKSDTQPKEYAIAFEFQGDAKKRRHLFYRCISARASVESKTKENKISPNTAKLSITAMPRLDNNVVKTWAEEGDAAYANWYTTEAPYETEEAVG